MSLQIKKSKDRFHCPAFLQYIRTLPCEDCKALGVKQTTRTTASHMISVKWADGSDALAVPQCLTHHLQSTKKAKELLESHGVDVPELHRKLQKDFLEMNAIHLPVLTQEDFEYICKEAGFTE